MLILDILVCLEFKKRSRWGEKRPEADSTQRKHSPNHSGGNWIILIKKISQHNLINCFFTKTITFIENLLPFDFIAGFIAGIVGMSKKRISSN